MARRDEFLRLVARLAAAQAGIPADARQAFEDNVVCAANGELSRMFSGETVRFSICRVPHETRAQRNQRILTALEAGEAVAVVARRESVSPRLVQWLRQRQRNVQA